MTTPLAEIKALIDGAGTALKATYRLGHVPEGAELPYSTVLDPLSDAPVLRGDARTLGRRRLLQVDVWQDEAAEDDTLIDVLVAAIDGARLSESLRARVDDTQLVPGAEEDAGIVHHALTVSVVRVASSA